VLRSVGINLGDRTRLWITRFFILCLGVYLVTFGLWYKTKTDIWTFLALTGTMYFAGAATLLAFGLYWKRANVAGAFAGLICGVAPGLFNIVIYIATLIMKKPAAGEAPGLIARINASLSEPLIGLISYPLAIVGMIVGSLVYERLRGGGPSGEEPGVPAPADNSHAPSLHGGAEPEGLT